MLVEPRLQFSGLSDDYFKRYEFFPERSLKIQISGFIF